MSSLLRVLIIEDSEASTAILVNELKRGGYSPIITQASTTLTSINSLNQQTWDLIIANYSIPNFDVLTVLKVVRDLNLNLPFIVVSDTGGEDIPVSVIRAGAHDYILKNNLSRLLPAVERELQDAAMRQAAQEAETALRESEANLLALIENTQDAVWSIDPDYCLITYNSVSEQLFHQAFGIQAHQRMDLVSAMPREVQFIWINYYSRALQGDRFVIEHHFGQEEFEISFNPILTRGSTENSNQITGVAVFGRSITERKRAEAALKQAKDQLQAVLDAVPGSVSWFTSDLVYRGINRYLAESFNLPPDVFIGQEIGFMENSPDFAAFVRQFFAGSMESSTVEISAFLDDRLHSYLVAAQKYDQGQAAVFVGLDITDRRQVEEALRESQERYALAASGANDGLWDWNLRTEVIYYGPRWKSMLGWEDYEIGYSPDEWFNRIHPDDVERVKAELFLHFGDLTSHFESEHRMQHKDGSYRWMLVRGLAVRDEQGQASRMAGSQTDITERKRAEEQLLQDAFYDGLTGLPNRALFLDRLGQAIERLKRLGNYLFAVLFIDLDRFKIVNDSLGRKMGDELLAAAGHRLKTCIQGSDTLAHVGEDEYVILIEDLKDASETTRLADRIHALFQAPFDLQGHEVFCTVSIGIALSESHYDRPEDLLRDADIAMYRAKTLGRSRHEIFESAMHAGVIARLRLETDLRRAVERQEFFLEYQPIVCLRSGEIKGFEALIRWQHPGRGRVSPGEFIPVVEENGLIVPIGHWVLCEACRQLKTWQQAVNLPLTISVNLSGKQFSQANLVQQIDEILQEVGLPANVLKLEITETMIMDNAEAAIVMLQDLKALGIHLQIDDFGTGYSSFSHLHRFPTDTLKIDQSFVRRLGAEDDSLEIVRTIVTLAHSLGMTITAEGVETQEQVSCLQAVNAELGQGYFFSKAVARDRALAMLQNCPRWLN